MATAPDTLPAPNALQGLARMTFVRQITLLVLLCASVALGVTIALWSQTPNREPLYGRDLGNEELPQVLEALRQEGIDFDVDRGLIMVPSTLVHEARMKLAAQGMPKSTDQGMELLSEPQGFGISQFQELARYKHALEVELQRSIMSLNAVESARVHLALPRQSAFLKRNQSPSASVVVHVARGRRLDEGQGENIAFLVAAAVPNMEPANVRVLDDKGRLLTDPDANGLLGKTMREFELKRMVEADVLAGIEDILVPLVGPDGVKATVNALVDMTRVERSRETFNPDTPALRSEILAEESGNGQFAGGVPGALTNQPPGAGQAPEQAGNEAENAGAAGGGASRSSRQHRNYELDRAITYSQTMPGKIRRLSVAVVIDDRRTVAEDGTVTRTPRTPEELSRLTALVKDAVGFDAARGDTVRLANETFAEREAEPAVPELPLWKQPWVWDMARQAGGVLLVLFLAFGVLRPTMRNLVAREVTERELEQSRIANQLTGPGEEGGEEGAAGVPGEEGTAALAAPGVDNERFEQVRALVTDDPRRAANAVRSWVSADG